MLCTCFRLTLEFSSVNCHLWCIQDVTLFDFGQGYWPVQGGSCDFTFYTHNSNCVTAFFPSIHAHSVVYEINCNQFLTLFRISMHAHFAKFTVSCRKTRLILFFNILMDLVGLSVEGRFLILIEWLLILCEWLCPMELEPQYSVHHS